jgi:hypothetical protein
MRVWWGFRCKSSDQLDFSLQSEWEDQMSCVPEKQQLLDCTGGDGVNAKRQKIGKALQKICFFQSEYVHSCIFSQDLGCWDRFACEYLTTILHHFGSVNAWILQLPTAICGPTSGLWCGGPVDFGYCCLCCRWEKMKVVAEKNRRERARLEEEVGSSLTCLHCFFVLPIALGLQNLWWVSLQVPSCWVILDVVCNIYIYMLMQTILVVWCS